MRLIRRLYRLGLLALHLVTGICLQLIFSPRQSNAPLSARYIRIIRWWHGRMCRILGLRVTTIGSPPAGSAFVAANHVSWMDIHVLGSVMDGSFLSKEEVRRWPVVGALATMAGTLYIQRGGKDASNAASELLTWHLIRGTNVLVFPEGTTSDGNSLRRFHPRLFAAALLADRPVQPVAIRYWKGDEPHPVAAFVGDQGLLDNLWGVLGERRIETTVSFCAAVSTKGADRRSVAETANKRIAAVLENRPAEDRSLRGS